MHLRIRKLYYIINFPICFAIKLQYRFQLHRTKASAKKTDLKIYK